MTRAYAERPRVGATRSDPFERAAHQLVARAARAPVAGPEVHPSHRPQAQAGHGGLPLSPETRAFFEPRFGHDFSQVRVHADTHADELARAEHARAFVRGGDIVFAAGQYAPETPEGRDVLAHELAHVTQHSGKIQRWDWGDVVDVLQWTNPLTIGQKAIRTLTGAEVNLLEAAEQTVRLSATRISIPDDYVTQLRSYARANPSDGAMLTNALDQGPKYYQGGWLLSVQGDAEAITFGNSIFFHDAPPTVDTFIHELVHIYQYYHLGRAAFLASYFGASLATILWRAAHGVPIQAMKSSPHEIAAYNLEKRFAAWRGSAH